MNNRCWGSERGDSFFLFRHTTEITFEVDGSGGKSFLIIIELTALNFNTHLYLRQHPHLDHAFPLKQKKCQLPDYLTSRRGYGDSTLVEAKNKKRSHDVVRRVVKVEARIGCCRNECYESQESFAFTSVSSLLWISFLRESIFSTNNNADSINDPAIKGTVRFKANAAEIDCFDLAGNKHDNSQLLRFSDQRSLSSVEVRFSADSLE
ncbi:hypothetical protein C0J52_21686 [Blattella germanica]|nr:hypothetical protein C0J52_21686 [Blattella germanica]